MYDWALIVVVLFGHCVLRTYAQLCETAVDFTFTQLHVNYSYPSLTYSCENNLGNQVPTPWFRLLLNGDIDPQYSASLYSNDVPYMIIKGANAPSFAYANSGLVQATGLPYINMTYVQTQYGGDVGTVTGLYASGDDYVNNAQTGYGYGIGTFQQIMPQTDPYSASLWFTTSASLPGDSYLIEDFTLTAGNVHGSVSIAMTLQGGGGAFTTQFNFGGVYWMAYSINDTYACINVHEYLDYNNYTLTTGYPVYECAAAGTATYSDNAAMYANQGFYINYPEQAGISNTVWDVMMWKQQLSATQMNNIYTYNAAATTAPATTHPATTVAATTHPATTVAATTQAAVVVPPPTATTIAPTTTTPSPIPTTIAPTTAPPTNSTVTVTPSSSSSPMLSNMTIIIIATVIPATLLVAALVYALKKNYYEKVPTIGSYY